MIKRETYPFSKESLEPSYYLPHLFSISGDGATGTSTTMEWLRGQFPPHFSVMSAGDQMREFARGDIDRFTRDAHAGKYRGSYDQRVDAAMKYFGNRDYFCGDGRLSYLFVPRGFHIRQVCFDPGKPGTDPGGFHVRAGRRWRQLRKKLGKNYPSLSEVLRKLQERDALDRERYDLRYPGWRWKDGQFDCVVNSFLLKPKQILAEINKQHQIWLEKMGSRVRHPVRLFQ